MTNQISRKEALLEVYSDVFKDAYGFRPRGECIANVHVDNCTAEMIEADMDRLQAMTAENEAAESAHADQQVVEFEAQINRFVEYSNSRTIALRWMANSHNINCHRDAQGIEGLLYASGILFHSKANAYLAEIQAAMAV